MTPEAAAMQEANAEIDALRLATIRQRRNGPRPADPQIVAILNRFRREEPRPHVCLDNNADPHCVVCHSHDHRACMECGACLFASFRDWCATRTIRRAYQLRRDRRYCSSACRQRAYRERIPKVD